MNLFLLLGAAIFYLGTQLMILWMVQVSMLFWKLLFPFHARHWEQRGSTFKYIHVGTVVLAILFPAILITISLNVGAQYKGVDYLPQLCGPDDKNVSYYTFLLPGGITSAVGVTLLWIIAWRMCV